LHDRGSDIGFAQRMSAMGFLKRFFDIGPGSAVLAAKI